MDMKKILQAMDGISTKPVEGVDSMSKFLRVVKEANLNQTALTAPESTLSPEQLAYNQLRAQLDSADSVRSGGNTYADVSPEVTASTNLMRTKLAQMAAELEAKGIDAEAEYAAPDPAVPAAAPVDLNQTYNENSGMSRFLSIMNEGASPHTVALPVQMAMNHYQTAVKPAVRKDRLIDKYFTEAEAAITQRKEEKRAKINQYASIIAERVMMKESKQVKEAGEAGWGRTGMTGVGLQPIDELSTELLGKYKKAAGADAKAADAEGDFERGNKRFKGINKATIKQFDNDAKKHKALDEANDPAQFAKPPQVPQVPAKDGMYGSWEFTTRKDGDRSATHPQYGTFVWDNSGAGGAIRPITWSLPSNSIPGMSWVTDFVSGTHTLEYTLKLGAGDLEYQGKMQTKLDGTPMSGSVGLKGRGHEANFTSANGKATGTYKDPDGKETSWDVPPESAGEVKQEGLDQLLALRNKIDEAIKQRLDPKCWKGKHKEGTKIKGGVRVNNCVPNKK